MSVETTADSLLKEIKSNVNSAVSDMSILTCQWCAGYEDYEEEYRDKLDESFKKLLEIKRLLK